MTILLSPDELMCAAQEAKLPGGAGFTADILVAVDRLASALASHLNVIAGAAEFGPKDFGGTLVAFRQGYPGQTCPPALQSKDPDGEFEP